MTLGGNGFCSMTCRCASLALSLPRDRNFLYIALLAYRKRVEPSDGRLHFREYRGDDSALRCVVPAHRPGRNRPSGGPVPARSDGALFRAVRGRPDGFLSGHPASFVGHRPFGGGQYGARAVGYGPAFPIPQPQTLNPCTSSSVRIFSC